jgi:hypothetical protein
MALLTTLALALLLTVTALTAWPLLAAATDGGPMATDGGTAAPALRGNPSPPPSPQATVRRQDTRQNAPLPKRGKASNPYDMEALQNFDAGSHR